MAAAGGGDGGPGLGVAMGRREVELSVLTDGAPSRVTQRTHVHAHTHAHTRESYVSKEGGAAALTVLVLRWCPFVFLPKINRSLYSM